MATKKKAPQKRANVKKKVSKKKAAKKSAGRKKSASKPAIKDGSQSLLLEIGTEELPSSSLKRLGEALGKGLHTELKDAGLLDEGANMRWFAAPRRLAVHISKVKHGQEDQDVERRGPAVAAAFDDDGQPTQAAKGFAGSCGVEVDALERMKTDKGEWLFFKTRTAGRAATEILPEAIDSAVAKLPVAKRMRWGDGSAEFARPVHWVVLLHGKNIVPASVFDIAADRISHGHRFHCKKPLRITDADAYEKLMKSSGQVIADFAIRRDMIQAQVEKLAAKVKGKAMMSDALLDEVTSLVEFPNALIGEIDREFMSVPQEVLVSSMKDHQKYFPVVSSRGKLLPHFITVSNLKLSNPARVRSGNERVLRSRLSDARFFWDTDRKQTLADRFDDLEGVLFHNALGSTKQKALRLETLAGVLAGKTSSDEGHAKRAAKLAKIDLVTDMVGEFDELQGTIGRYYAEHANEPEEVSVAIGDHYRPRFAGDDLPTNDTGKLVALADKLDTVTGIFAAGEEPTGDRDPYGLRRAALGILRILSEGGVDLDIGDCVEQAQKTYAQQGHDKLALDAQARDKTVNFMLDRLRAHYNSAGFGTDEINAVRAAGSTRPLDFERRLRGVANFRKLDAAASLSAANKRIQNILKKADDKTGEVDASLFEGKEEKALYKALSETSSRVEPMIDKGDYSDALTSLAELRDPVDSFFNEVMVMAEDSKVRQNRLSLLNAVGQQFLRIADISLLQD